MAIQTLLSKLLTFNKTPVLFALIALICFYFDDLWGNYLVYDRAALEQGQLWRLFTGHFFHTNGTHLLLNLAGLLLLWLIHGQYYQSKQQLLLWFSAALITSIGIYVSSDLEIYVGLSGILHGIFIWGALMDIKNQERTGYLLLCGVWLKIAHEQFYGASDSVRELIEANVAVDAHLWGAVAGTAFFLVSQLLSKQKLSQQKDGA